MWPKTARRGRFSSIAASSAGLPKLPSPAPSQWPFGRRVQDQHRALGAGRDHRRSPPRRRGRSSSPRGWSGCRRRGRRTRPRRSSSPRRAGRSPRPSRRPRRAARRRSRCCRGRARSASDRGQGADRLLQPLVDRGEVAGADHDVGVGRHLDQLRALLEVAVEVAEGEHLHARNLPARRRLRAPDSTETRPNWRGRQGRQERRGFAGSSSSRTCRSK